MDARVSSQQDRPRWAWLSPLLLAAALSPALLQQYSCDRGDTYLTSLSVQVDGVEQIASFNVNDRDYEIVISADLVELQVETRAASSIATYFMVQGGTSVSGLLGTGGGSASVAVPPGQSTLRVGIRAEEGALGYYNIQIARPLPCTEQGVLEAVAYGGGPHFFACDGPTTVATLGEVVIDKDVVLDGGGNLVLDANQEHRVLSVVPGVAAELIGITLSRGLVPVDGEGGGVLNEGTLTIRDSVLEDNITRSVSAGVGVYSSGTLTVADSVIRRNGSSKYEISGAGIHNAGAATLVRSEVSGNVAGSGAAGVRNVGALTILDTLFDNQSADGPDISSTGGLTMVGSTVGYNNFWGILSSGTATVINSTIEAVQVEASIDHRGGGTFTLIGSTVAGEGSRPRLKGGTFYVVNSIIAGTCGDAVVVSGGGNVETGNTCGFNQSSDLVDVTGQELALGPLADNGGPTVTRALLAGSVAMDRVDPANCVDEDGGSLATDQRGMARPQGAACDAGAFEAQFFSCTEQGIRDAVVLGGGPHYFECDGPTTVATLAEIIIDNDVVLEGEGDLTIDGDNDHRVFSVPPEITTELRGLHIRGGFLDSDGDRGAGILNDGNLTITNGVVASNGVPALSSGISLHGGGIYNTGTLTLQSTSVRENNAAKGCGIYNTGAATLIDSSVSHNGGPPESGTIVAGASGSGINNDNGTLTLIGSTVSFNQDGRGDAAAIDSHPGTVLLINSVVSNNRSTQSPGVWATGGTTTLINSTVSGNVSGLHSAIEWNGSLSLINSTIFGDETRSGSRGVIGQTNWMGHSSELRVVNSVIMDPDTIPANRHGCYPAPDSVISGGGNIESPFDSCGLDHPTDLVNVTTEQLGLGPLADNGGPTLTHGLLAGSVAIDHVEATACLDQSGDPLATDQRGVARPQGAACDAGAFEWADCSGAACDDGNDCTADYCDPLDGSWCANSPLPDGTLCSGGVCSDGACDLCPSLTNVLVTPLLANVGDEINVSAVASAENPINYLWTATGGSFADPTSAITTYLCEEAGEQTLTVTVSDVTGSCSDEIDLVVTCVDP